MHQCERTCGRVYLVEPGLLEREVLGTIRPAVRLCAPERETNKECVRAPSPTLSPTDPVPRGLLTLCPGAQLWPTVSVYVCM